MGHRKTGSRLATLCFLAGASCTDVGPSKHSLPNAGSGNATNGNCLDLNLTAATSWQGGIGTIFQNNCAPCHADSYGTYTGVKGNISGVLASIDAGSMPKSGPLSQTDKDAIHAWASAGMLETDAANSSTKPSNCTNGAINGSSPAPSPETNATPTQVEK